MQLVSESTLPTHRHLKAMRTERTKDILALLIVGIDLLRKGLKVICELAVDHCKGRMLTIPLPGGIDKCHVPHLRYQHRHRDCGESDAHVPEPILDTRSKSFVS